MEPTRLKRKAGIQKKEKEFGARSSVEFWASIQNTATMGNPVQEYVELDPLSGTA